MSESSFFFSWGKERYIRPYENHTGGAFGQNIRTRLFCSSFPPVAQLVEQLPFKETVVGSIPTGRTRTK